MISPRSRRLVSLGALAAGIAIFAVTLYRFDFTLAFAAGRRLAVAVLLAIAATGLTHLIRTWAWAWCFARRGAIPFGRLFRVRLASEAFSYLTIASLAGDPLKVVLLGDRARGHEGAAAVALERIAFIIGTLLVVGAAALVTLLAQPLSHGWRIVFRGFAIGTAVFAAAIVLILVRRDSYLLAAFRAADRKAGTKIASSSTGRYVGDVGREIAELMRGDSRRMVVLTLSALLNYACMVAEVWLVLHAVGVPITVAGAVAVETFTRVASFASALIPANLGALEASTLAAAAAVSLDVAGAPLAVARRLRGLFWAGVGLAIYPRRTGNASPGADRRITTGEQSAA